MSIKASVNQVDDFSSSIGDLQSSFENGISSISQVCDIVETSIMNFQQGIQSVLSQIETDISNAEYWLYQNESLSAKLESQKDYAEKRLAVVQDEADIKNYQKTIANCERKLSEISSKNAKLNSIISKLKNYRNRYNDLQRKVPKLDEIKPIRKNLDQLKSESNMLCSKFNNKATTAQKLIAKIDENLSYVAEVSSSSGRVVTVHNARSLTDMAHSLRAVNDSISGQNGGFLSEVSSFSSVIQDKVTNNAVALCEESARIVDNLVDNFNDLANHFEKAAKYLAEYENLA